MATRNYPVQNQNGGGQVAQVKSLEDYLNNSIIRQKFHEVLNKGAGAFIGSLQALTKQNHLFANCDAKSTVAAAMKAATLKLPIDQNLGFAYIIPYGKQAQFQMGYKGFVQLAMRSGQYKTINASVVHEGEVEGVDFISGEIIRGQRTGNNVIGYVAYFQLINGFSKTLYMTKEEIEQHARKFSKAYNSGPWKTNCDQMALKTVLKLLISRYGIMSIDMQDSGAMATALTYDQAAVGDDGAPQYIDNPRSSYNQQPQQPPIDIQPQEAPIPFNDADADAPAAEPAF